MQEPCWWCKGTGRGPVKLVAVGAADVICPRCDGTGRLPMLRQPTLPGESV